MQAAAPYSNFFHCTCLLHYNMIKQQYSILIFNNCDDNNYYVRIMIFDLLDPVAIGSTMHALGYCVRMTCAIHRASDQYRYSCWEIYNLIKINTGECGYPTLGDEAVTILSHMHTDGPWLEGSTISYSCPSGLKIAGTNTSTCMDNGQWEPDPSDITCAGNHHSSFNIIIVFSRCP